MPSYVLTNKNGERYTISPEGHISRPSIGMGPSGRWIARALVRFDNFGHIVEKIDFAEWPTIADMQRDMRRKNGKPIWFLADLDHDSERIGMGGVIALRTL